MHGAGNDYVYVDAFTRPAEIRGVDWPDAARRLSDRRFGIGGDGLILIERPVSSAAGEARMRIWNADGTEAEMCGNGIRCVAKFLVDRGLAEPPVRIETRAGVLAVEVERGPDGKVARARASVGAPRAIEPGVRLSAAGRAWEGVRVSMGNPHYVIFVGDIDAAPVGEAGPAIERHPLFPDRTNVEFVEVVSSEEVRQRTWERGAGETLACGTGASAVCVAGATTGRTGRRVVVHLRGGDLEIEWADGGEVFMTGPAAEVFEAEIDPAAIAPPR